MCVCVTGWRYKGRGRSHGKPPGQPQGERGGGQEDPGQPVQVFREDEQGAAVQQVRWRQRHFPTGRRRFVVLLTEVH